MDSHYPLSRLRGRTLIEDMILTPAPLFERNADMNGDLVMMDNAHSSYFAINQVGARLSNRPDTRQTSAALNVSVLRRD